jgi:hypothetical protein
MADWLNKMKNDKMVNGFMKKKLYINPKMEILDLRAIDATMQHAFGPASAPSHMGGAPRRRDSVF